jgi:hypothetical protein
MYRLQKNFRVWRSTIKWKKFNAARTMLAENLFIVTPDLARALLQLRFELVQLYPFKFVDTAAMEKSHLFQFIEKQMGPFEQLRDFLREYRRKMQDILCNYTRSC